MTNKAPRTKEGYISSRCPVCGGYMKKSKKNPKLYICNRRCGYYYIKD